MMSYSDKKMFYALKFLRTHNPSCVKFHFIFNKLKSLLDVGFHSSGDVVKDYIEYLDRNKNESASDVVTMEGHPWRRYKNKQEVT